MNIRFFKKLGYFFSPTGGILLSLFGTASFFLCSIHYRPAYSAPMIYEPIQACVIATDVSLTDAMRAQYAQCLGWTSTRVSPLCLGSYQPVIVEPLENPDVVQIQADKASFYSNQRSKLSGHVEIQQGSRIVNAQTAYVYRDAKTNQVTQIELLGQVRYLEPDRLMIARKAILHPQDKSGQVEDVIYRFNTDRSHAILPAWGRASLIRRYANQDYLLKQATYSTCAPQDKAWDLRAKTIILDNAEAKGVARDATLRIHDIPIFYSPYFSFPTNKDRKSGFLMPIVGYTNIGGFDFGLPYYWNMAPNYDMTLTPHLYTKRGLMMSDQFRYLTSNSTGVLEGSFLPKDKAFNSFLIDNELLYPRLQGVSSNRWSYNVTDKTYITPDFQMNLNLQGVSDDYYFQDFSSNLVTITQRQVLRQADLIYSTEHWVFRGMGQSYQTLHPINEIPISSVYERLPQLMAQGTYYDLPFNAQFSLLGQYDQFRWPTDRWDRNPLYMPQGPRFHVNPVLSIYMLRPWGFLTPSVELVENYYDVQNQFRFGYQGEHFNRSIPRFHVDSGLFFERNLDLLGAPFTQTLEPRLFYLRVPYQNQTPIPVYDSGNMIFSTDQLFRTNRFSGFDRIGDANQLSYALTTRLLSDDIGRERASFTVGQIRYFADRKVQLCQSLTGYCIDDPLTFGNLSPTEKVSPVASRALYRFNPAWSITGDYVWDPATRATNNADLNVHYQPVENAIFSGGYSYLVNGDVTTVRNNGSANNALNQVIGAFVWPLSERWSTIGAYSQNISKNYSMMSLFGVQYDSCCWAMRVLGGRTFKNLNQEFQPQYNNNVYVQLLLKGLGSVANSDPYNILNTYIPGYYDPFRY